MLFSYNIITEPEDDGRHTCRCPHTVYWELFQRLQPYACPNHNQMPISSKLERFGQYFAGCLFFTSPDVDFRCTRFVLGPDWDINPRQVCDFDAGLDSLINLVVKEMFEYHYFRHDSFRHDYFRHDYFRHCYYRRHIRTQPQSSFLQIIFHMTSNISRQYANKDIKSIKRATPLTRLLLCFWNSRVIYSWTPHAIYRQLRDCLSNWLQLLVGAGVDLNAYGKIENQLLHGEVEGEGQAHVLGQPALCWLRLRCAPNKSSELTGYDKEKSFWGYKSKLLGFKFGPKVEDWQAWFTEPTDRFAGHFWKLVETTASEPSLSDTMPGSWVDGDDCEDSEYLDSDED